MTTLAQWIEDVRGHIDGDRSGEANVLASPYTAASGTLTFTYALGNIGEGAILSIGTNTLRVLSVNALTKTATVVAGWNGSDDANASTGAMVRVNPRFTDHRIVRSINDTLASLTAPPNNLYQVPVPLAIAYTGTVEAYDLTGVTGLVKVLEVRREMSGVSMARTRQSLTWELDRNAVVADFPSGYSIRIRGAEPTYRVWVEYAKEFTPITTLATNVSTTGIRSTAEDIPPMGAAIRLVAPREIARNHPGSQGDSRRAEEVPPGATANSYRGLTQFYLARVREEAARLSSQYRAGR